MQGYLSQHGDERPLISARWLLSDATGLSNMQLYTSIDRPLSPDELDTLRENVKYRAAGEPLQYITGKTSFRHIELMVRKGVLIPRPETEVLVSEVLDNLPSSKYNVDDANAESQAPFIRVADLCTGSGCIACSLAYENKDVEVVATDISSDCVSLAKENVKMLGLSDRVSVIESDLGDALEGDFDVVVSNPPYVPTSVLAEIPQEVTVNEPLLALDGGSDGLKCFRRLAEWAYDSLKSDGFLAVELHETTLDAAADFAQQLGYARTKITKDLAGKPRILTAYKSS